MDKATNRLTLHQGRKAAKTYTVATGRSQNLTPEGTFKVVTKFIKPGWKGIAGGLPKNPLGERWIGIQVNGDQGRTYGIHGTNQPNSIGTHASSGCVRMKNRDVIDLYKRVPAGTKVKIHNGKPNPKVTTTSGKVTVTAQLANIRKAPSMSGQVLQRVVGGKQLKAIGKKGNWVKIRLKNGQIAFIHQNIVR